MSEVRDMDRRLRLAREVFSPSPDHRERVHAGLVARGLRPISTTPATPATGVTSSKGSKLVGGWASASKAAGLGKATLLLGAGFALGYWFAQARGPELAAAPIAQVAVTSPPAPADAVLPGDPPSGMTLPEPASTPHDARTTKPTRSSTDNAEGRSSGASFRLQHPLPRAAPRPAQMREATLAPANSSDAFADEVALLQRAERAIRSGNGMLARSFIADLEARFPKTALHQERAAILVLAACALDEPDARRAAIAYSKSHPGSVYLDRIQALCQLDTSSSAGGAPEDGSASRGH
jgi:hypothetical protein